MKVRCDLHVNGENRKLVLVPGPTETPEHLALKLSAYLLFWEFEPQVEISAKHPAMAAHDFLPDLLALDEAGGVRLWVECGKTTLHKLSKLARRLPSARLVVLKASPAEARRLRAELAEAPERAAAAEIWAWGPAFKDWLGALREKTEIYGEAGPAGLNLVINETPIAAEFGKF